MGRLCVLTGAPGAGKTLLARELRAYPFAAVDFDELLEPDGSVLGIDIASPSVSAESVWPAYNRLWLRITALLLRAGGPVLVLCPLTPGEWAAAGPDLAGLPSADWARLDCADADRTARLTARGWASADIADALADAGELRAVVEREFSTTGCAPARVGAGVAEWVVGGGG
ncbi:hypothetical protein ABZX40_14335 [Streptomyces sp. NPDC004610]|uniref:hypothetical protein n=1 Tax=unclassified Streptomyces TaxID=2593676 RepID=UPI0033B8340C